MGLKLRKKIKDEKLYYLVSDASSNDTYYEFYLFENHKEIPSIESICYKIMGTELISAYEARPFSSVGYKSLLLVRDGIIIDGNVINVGTANIFYEIIQNIRYKDLYNVINSFRKKLSIKALNFFREKIMEIKVENLSEDTKDLFNKLLVSLNYKNDKDELFKEILFLATLNEYNRAYKDVYLEEQKINSYKEEVLKWEDELETAGN